MANDRKNGVLVEVPPQEAESNRLINFIDRVTESDLETLRSEIVRRENILNGMKKLEKVVASALGKEGPKKTHKKKAGKPEETVEDKRERVAKFLANGAQNGQQICQNCGVWGGQLAEIMNCPYFSQGPNGWTLTPQGRQKYC